MQWFLPKDPGPQGEQFTGISGMKDIYQDISLDDLRDIDLLEASIFDEIARKNGESEIEDYNIYLSKNANMAVVTCTTIGELYNDTSEHDDNGVLERLIQLVKNNFPEGWREWKVARQSKEDTVGANPDPQLLNKLRYALPTIGIATLLSERPYHDYKVKMLDWAFVER
ncbi:unnamed protein product [Parnassius apollo]|uniref:(apollo) hypothetical protein n=1 Tax=Parnassius apollo TaxID=110799 RepID=A0A8S3XPR6_PARAO|nr:unnamed protein product [Parnassius apollo]